MTTATLPLSENNSAGFFIIKKEFAETAHLLQPRQMEGSLTGRLAAEYSEDCALFSEGPFLKSLKPLLIHPHRHVYPAIQFVKQALHRFLILLKTGVQTVRTGDLE